MMQVALDGRVLNREHIRGIGRCVYELIMRGSSRHGIQWRLFADRPELPWHVPPVTNVKKEIFECRGYRLHTWEQWELPRRLARGNVHLFHGPASQLPWRQPVPSVVTIHDTIPWQQNEPGWRRGWYTDWVLPRAFRKAAAVITISECSRQDILRLWPALANRLHVIPNGVGDAYLNVDSHELPESLVALGVRRPYILYFGGTIPRKRLPWAIEVLDRLNDSRVDLVLCGISRDEHDAVQRGLKPELRRRVCIAPFVSDIDLPALYQNAIAVLYPTLYEGFGLPALESQAVGTPVLFSAVGSLVELAGPGAVVLPTYDMDAWVNTCRELVRQRASVSSPDLTARRWARQYSWDVYTDRTIRVYNDVLGRQAPHKD